MIAILFLLLSGILLYLLLKPKSVLWSENAKTQTIDKKPSFQIHSKLVSISTIFVEKDYIMLKKVKAEMNTNE